MWKLSEPELREFGIRGYVVIRDVILPAILAAASRAIERLVDEQPPPEGHGEQLRQLLLRLSGRQARRAQATTPALLVGMWVLLAMLDVLQHYNLADLKKIASALLPGYLQGDSG